MPYDKLFEPEDRYGNVDKLYYNIIIDIIDGCNGFRKKEILKTLIESLECKSWQDLAINFVTNKEAEGFKQALSYAIFPQMEIFNVPYNTDNAVNAISIALDLMVVFTTLMG